MALCAFRDILIAFNQHCCHNNPYLTFFGPHPHLTASSPAMAYNLRHAIAATTLAAHRTARTALTKGAAAFAASVARAAGVSGRARSSSHSTAHDSSYDGFVHVDESDVIIDGDEPWEQSFTAPPLARPTTGSRRGCETPVLVVDDDDEEEEFGSDSEYGVDSEGEDALDEEFEELDADEVREARRRTAVPTPRQARCPCWRDPKDGWKFCGVHREEMLERMVVFV